MNAIIIAGATATGKSQLALKMAKNCNGVIINADRYQLYDALRILTASPTKCDETIAQHKLYCILNKNDVCNAAIWQDLAINEINLAISQSITPIIVGGCGFYIDVLINGISDIPKIDESILLKLNEECGLHGAHSLYEKLKIVDPTSSIKINMNDKQRIIRALSVYYSTGKTISSLHVRHCTKFGNIKYYKILVCLPSHVLKQNILKRFNKMIFDGLLDEVMAFIDSGCKNPALLNAVGLNSVIKYLKNEITYEKMEEYFCRETWHYAKKQNTWFRNKYKYDLALE